MRYVRSGQGATDGYDVTTPIIISNTEQFAKVKACEDKVVTKESKLLSVQ